MLCTLNCRDEFTKMQYCWFSWITWGCIWFVELSNIFISILKAYCRKAKKNPKNAWVDQFLFFPPAISLTDISLRNGEIAAYCVNTMTSFILFLACSFLMLLWSLEIDLLNTCYFLTYFSCFHHHTNYILKQQHLASQLLSSYLKVLPKPNFQKYFWVENSSSWM